MLVDEDAWTRLGGLHESTFMYSEDLDLCWRAHEQGWTTWFEAEAEFVHLSGASSERRWSNRERSEQIARAEATMLRRHLSGFQAALTLGLMRVGAAARVVCLRVLRKPDAAASCRGVLDGLRGPAAAVDVPSPAPAVEIVRPET